MRKIRRTLVLTFSLIGVIFLLTGLGVGSWLHQSSAGMTAVTGTIADFAGSTPVVRYTVDGADYQARGNVSSTSQRLGDAYPLLVDPENPARVVDPGLCVLMWVFGGMGAAMLLAAGVAQLVMSARERRREALLGYGRRVSATVTAVRENRAVSVGRQHPLVVEAQCAHPITGASITLRATVWQTPLKSGDRVDALFDPVNEKKYALDLPDEDVQGNGSLTDSGR